ncbi:SPOCS domain-containing protein [Aneurinibacillus uraniidurans]|uniref:SPOCS domain-containing protein n=1 Tax=Aneurinibacillus uraniidurans TaxID=2966586 RepID=UPI0023498EC4|nr:SPOCS domain-containing protein [Aneurinibacillus sp. B1]WCN39553.1 DUF3794 domain-containing protein [Aneurinibacillus sp. B1]
MTDHRTQLIPPAKRNSTRVERELFAQVKKICDGIVFISGMVRKTITYTAVINKEEVPNQQIVDEIPFHGIIENEDIKEGEHYTIKEAKIICNVDRREANFGGPINPQTHKHSLAFRLLEKEIIRICIQKEKEQNSFDGVRF